MVQLHHSLRGNEHVRAPFFRNSNYVGVFELFNMGM